MARRTALFEQFGLEAPGASLSSTGRLDRTRRIKKWAKVSHIPSLSTPGAEICHLQTVYAPESQAPPDIDEDLGGASGNSIYDPIAAGVIL